MDWIRSFNPVNVTEAVRQLILCLSLFGVLTWSTEQQAGFLMAISAVFALFVRSNTISAVKLDQRVDERVAAVDAGVRGTKGSDGPDVAGTGSGYNKLSALLLVAVASLSIACASASGPLVLTEDAVHDSLAAVDDGVRKSCTGASAAILVTPCADVRKVLLPTLEAGQAFNRCVDSQRIGCVGPLIEIGGRLVTELKKLPESDSVRLISDLARALAAAFQRTGGK